VTAPAREELTVDSDGEQIGVEVCGEGPALALVHGSGGNRATWWPVMADLARDHRVVAVEARGAGRSTDSADSTGPQAGSRDLEAVRACLGIDRWTVLGHSLGTWTALRHAVEYPDRVDTVVLVSGVGGLFGPVADALWTQLMERLRAGPWPPVQALGRPPSLSPAFCERQPEVAHLYQLVGALNPPPSRTAPAARIRELDLTGGQVTRLSAPVHFLTGSLDPVAPVPAVKEAAAAVPGATFTVLDGVAHVPFWEDPAGFLAALRPLLPG
jgi:pimeloyl-ACP methyl ester carboxylesterase